LFDCLELLSDATSGKIDLSDHLLIKNIGQFIYKTYINKEFFINMGDAAAKMKPEPAIVYSYGKLINDPVMQQFGAFLMQQRGQISPADLPSWGNPARLLRTSFMINKMKGIDSSEPFLADIWYSNLQLMAARSEPGSVNGFYLAAWGGHNAQNHNHNDVGNFIVYSDGEPVLIDVGVENYTAKTFSKDRYDIWTMQSAYHNLPTINGFMQHDGTEYCATEVDFTPEKNVVTFSLDLAKAYPAKAKVNRWYRTLTLQRDLNEIELTDEYELAEFLEPGYLSLMTPLRIILSEPGIIKLQQADSTFIISYDAQKMEATSEDIKITDSRLRSVWGEYLTRIRLVLKSRNLKDQYKIKLGERSPR
jgi:hypothetical protein